MFMLKGDKYGQIIFTLELSLAELSPHKSLNFFSTTEISELKMNGKSKYYFHLWRMETMIFF